MYNIGLRRLVGQHVNGKHFKSVVELVDWMGVLQAQDLNSAKWALGVRLPGSTQKMIDDAIDSAEVIRIHILRPTWHFVSAENYPLFLALSAPNINAALNYRRIQLGLDEKLFAKSNPALNELLKDGNHLTREEITVELENIFPDLDSSKMNHILMEGEMKGLLCSGKMKNKLPTYALVKERINVNTEHKIDTDFALNKLASCYFRSHGPATLADFVWWSGLSSGDCRKALSMVKDKLMVEKEGKFEYWYDPEQLINNNNEPPEIALLPAFDEFIIAYKERSAVINLENHGRAVSANGIFRPVLVYEGQVVGLWNKTIKKDTLQIAFDWFLKPNKSVQKKFENSANDYAKFLGLKNSEVH